MPKNPKTEYSFSANSSIKSSESRTYRATESIAAGTGKYPVTRTSPDSLLRHDISDEELTILTSDENRSFDKDILWAAIGAVTGSAAPAISSLFALVSKKTDFLLIDLITFAIFSIGIAVSFIMGFLIFRQPSSSKARDLAANIRKRLPRNVSFVDS